MPIRIPTYISKGAPAVVDRGGVSPTATGGLVSQELESVSKVLAGIQLDADRKVADATRLAELVDRRGRFSDRIGQLQEELAQDTDHNTYFGRAKKGIEQAAVEAMDGINDPELKASMTQYVAAEKERRLLDARHQALKLKIDYSSAVGEENLERQVNRGLEATDARDLMAAEGEIDATVVGLVRGGVWTAERGEKTRRAARGKLETAMAERMADQEPGRFLQNYEEGVYKDSRIDPLRLETIRRYAVNRNGAVEASAAVTQVWEELGPKSDEDPVNLDLMVTAIESRFQGDADKTKLAIAAVREKAVAHAKGSAERRDANLSAIWKAVVGGAPSAQVIASKEFSALDGKAQIEVKEHLENRSWTMRQRARADGWVDPLTAARHEAYWRYSQPEELSGMTENAIAALYPKLGVDLTDDLMRMKRNLEKPGTLDDAKIDQVDFNHFARTYGISPEDTDNKAILGRIKYQVLMAVDAEQNRLGRRLSRKEKGEIMKRGLVEVDVRGRQTFLGAFELTGPMRKRVFDVEYPGNILIPEGTEEGERGWIEGQLRARGIPVTEETIRELYLRYLEK